MENRNGGAPAGTLLEVVHELKGELEALSVRLDQLEAPRRLRVRELEVVDEEGRPAVRLVARDDGTAGLECVRPGDTSLVSFVGVLGGEGALQFTGGRHGNVVLDKGARLDGPRRRRAGRGFRASRLAASPGSTRRGCSPR